MCVFIQHRPIFEHDLKATHLITQYDAWHVCRHFNRSNQRPIFLSPLLSPRLRSQVTCWYFVYHFLSQFTSHLDRSILKGTVDAAMHQLKLYCDVTECSTMVTRCQWRFNWRCCRSRGHRSHNSLMNRILTAVDTYMVKHTINFKRYKCNSQR